MTITAEIATGMSPSPEDVAEYEERVARLRELMRNAGLDAVIVSDAHPYSRWLTGFAVPRHKVGFESGPEMFPRSAPAGELDAADRAHQSPGADLARRLVTVIVPLSGDVSLVVPRSGFYRSVLTAARMRSWVPRIVGTYSEDPEEERRTMFGSRTQEAANDVARTIQNSGLANARIGVIGGWAGMERTRAQLPNARFEPARMRDVNGIERDLLDILTDTYSPWEMRRMQRAQAAGEAGIRAFMKAAVDGALYSDVVKEAEYTAERTCDIAYTFLPISSPGTPWMAEFPGTYPAGRKVKNGDLIAFEFITNVEDYMVQNCRNWVVGQEPNQTQRHVMETTKRTLEVALPELKVGATGEHIWNVCLEVLRKADLEPWTRMGHLMGPKHNKDNRFEFLPGKRTPFHEGLAVVLHPTPIDKATMTSGLMGDMYIVGKNGPRPLSSSPLSYDFTV